MALNRLLKLYYFYFDTLHSSIENKLTFVKDVILRKEKFRLKLRNGPTLIFTFHEIIQIQAWKKLLEYGIEVKRSGTLLEFFGFPVLQLSVDVSELNTKEFLNLVGLIFECVKYGIKLSDFNRLGNFHFQDENMKIDFHKKIIITPDGAKFALGNIDPGIFSETYIQKIHNRLIGDFNKLTVLDVGANFGDTPIYFAKRGAIVWAIEPVKLNYEALIKNLALNSELKVSVSKYAIGPLRNLVINSSTYSLDGSASGFYTKGHAINETVESLSVREFLKRKGLDQIDFLKMDCKGCERYLSQDDLKCVKKYLHIEFDPYSSTDDINNLIDLVNTAGFDYAILNHNVEAGLGYGKNFGTIYASRRLD